MSSPAPRISLVDLPVLLVMLIAGFVILLPHVHRSAFFDEAWVIDAAIAPTPTEGWAVLLHDKSPAGAGYTAMLHQIAVLAPPTGPLLRIAHAIFALAAVLLAMRLAYSWHPRGWAMILPAAMLLAMPMFQRYSTEVKQYILEAAIALGLILAAQAWVGSGGGGSEARTLPGRASRRAAWAWFILALLAIIMTFSGWFSVAGTSGVVFLAHLFRRDIPQLKRTLAFGVAIAAVAAVMHTQFNKHISGSSVLEGYWTDYYPPLSAQWPAKVWEVLTKMLDDCWFRYERLPGQAMLIAAMVGFIAWIRRQPASGLAALAIIAVTLAASTAKLWPLNLRVNLHMLVILHIAIAAGPVILGAWTIERVGVARPAHATLTAAVSFFIALLFAGVILRESRSANYETETNRLLLDEVAKSAAANDIVILLPAAAINQRLDSREIAGTVRVAPWPAKATIIRDILPLAAPLNRNVILAVSHHKPASGVPEAIAELNQAFSPFGRFFQQRFEGDEAGNVAIYRFEPAK